MCFVDATREDGSSAEYLNAVREMIVSSGEAWVATARINDQPVIRACVVNFRTEPKDAQIFVEVLNEARGKVAASFKN